jgi:alkanesulfonate monooxygenase SsuD/methylene tetrahydromethanopterin reductase-like flavin-dependent oxidoreductase (luciferase family)
VGGFFLGDHVAYREPVRAVAGPWITLAAVAAATRGLIIGPLVMPLPRRRPPKLARETVTLDRLSGGRLILGVGIDSDRSGELDRDRFGEEGKPRSRARLLDDGLERLAAYWDGRSTCPAPMSWRSWPPRFGSSAAPTLARPSTSWSPTAGNRPGAMGGRGATWYLTGFGPQPTRAEVERAIDDAPGR